MNWNSENHIRDKDLFQSRLYILYDLEKLEIKVQLSLEIIKFFLDKLSDSEIEALHEILEN